MSIHKRILIILLHLGVVFMLPLITELIDRGGHIPYEFFKYPIIEPVVKPGFNLIYFLVILVGCIIVSALILFPRLFGFKEVNSVAPSEKKKTIPFPIWFWLGLAVHLVCLVVSWGKISMLEFLIRFQLIPLWWGFILILDGIVYKRNNGSSILADRPKTVIAVAISSSLGWMYYAYLNFYVDSNWYYLAGGLVNSTVFFTYAVIGSAAFWPLVFEWYSLMNTFDWVKSRYSKGPKLVINRKIQIAVVLVGWAMTGLVSFWPNLLFFGIWLGPMISLMGILGIVGIWTPFTPISKEGNWSPLILMALAATIQGFFWEMWNYFSVFPLEPIQAGNPAFWKYSIPYVEVAKIFEMPVLGYFGYLPFGIYCWVWWLMFAFLLGIPHRITLDKSESEAIDVNQLSA